MPSLLSFTRILIRWRAIQSDEIAESGTHVKQRREKSIFTAASRGDTKAIKSLLATNKTFVNFTDKVSSFPLVDLGYHMTGLSGNLGG